MLVHKYKFMADLGDKVSGYVSLLGNALMYIIISIGVMGKENN